MNVASGENTRITDSQTSGSWSPSGTEIAYIYGDRIHIRNLASGVTQDLAPTITPTTSGPPVWSPDGLFLVVAGSATNPFVASGVLIIRRSDGARLRLTSGGSPGGYSWSPQ